MAGKQGFTLLELIIVLALGVTLTTVGFISFSGAKYARDVEASTRELAAALRETRVRSVTQQDAERWGMRVVSSATSTDYYETYTGTPYAAENVKDTRYLQKGVSFAEPADGRSVDFSFEPVTGRVDARKVVTITHDRREGLAGDVVVDTFGRISFRNDFDVAGYWHFDEGTGTSTADSSGYGNGGTLVDATWTATSTCVAGRCLTFDGSSNYVQVNSADSLNPGSGPFSVEVWFKLNAAGSLNASILYNKENLYEASAGGGYFSYAWQPYWNWTLVFPVTVGEWYHTVIVYDGVNQTIYENGTAVSTRPQTGNMGTNTNALRIGARGAPGAASSFFPGVIDEMTIYNRALTAGEVAARYNELR